MIPYGRQNVNQEDIDSVIEVLESDYLTQGKMVNTFEDAICKKVSAKYAVAVNSATSALHLACKALELGPGDLAWTSAISFVASANCALYCGADIDFIDIERETVNISVSELEQKLQRCLDQSLPLPKVLIVVHMAGHSADMKGIKQLSEQYGFRIIEDASHAIGSRYLNESVGSCQFSDAAIFSFHPVKIITTGEGGVLTTNCETIANTAKLLRSHGITRDNHDRNEGWYYEQLQLGFNYRLTDIQAALGFSQLKRLDEFVKKRQEKASYYIEQLSKLDLLLPNVNQLQSASWHLFIIQLKRHDRHSIFDCLRKKGIGVNVHYIPIYLQPYYRDKGFSSGYCPNAENYYSSALSLPLYPDLTKENQKYIIDVLKEVLQ
ncbi:UDP-4-amino-4,6-dideoxy-N-acetyl-beta-L-altrosamine transaminase [Bermanella marisrubri]|uniref:Flagellin modification protein/polysaccharide biosynthesis protein n=2 Tax=Bermanella marisrubri TaxID=207949 RepID=Q1N2Z2_9GAMM|nr:flagellin modification protein/polysaccharide biosynthesis protein [Oceanobacter sp. RED65] [Bermanella marisrubri]QIZ85851.1 UDP-4-amino-4,6-dideoxy-N-acetyl-beta-L-altrosamine transaminase [Bermanella marisrubri]